MEDIELILVNISGADRPGVTSALTDILARHEASILDIGQADIHHSLSLGILFRTSSDRSGDIMTCCSNATSLVWQYASLP